MRRSLLSVLFICTALPAVAGAMERLIEEATFRAHFVGKTMVWKGGSQVIHDDGSITGNIEALGGDYTGSWGWEDGFYCRNLVIQGNDTGTDCLIVEIDGQNVRLHRDQGRGRVYDVELR